MTEEKKLAMDPKTGKPFKVLVVGPEGVGKTCMVFWFLRNRLVIDDVPHVCFDTYPCTVDGSAVELVDGPEALLDPENKVFDFEFKFHALRAAGMIAVFDVTARHTLADALTVARKTLIMRHADGLAPLPCVLIGTHIDEADRRVVTADEGREAAAQHAASYAEVSAHTGENVHTALTAAITELLACYPGANDNESEDADADSSHRRRGCTHQ